MATSDADYCAEYAATCLKLRELYAAKKRIAELEEANANYKVAMREGIRIGGELEIENARLRKHVAELEALVPHPGDGSCDRCGRVPAAHVPTNLCPDCWATEEENAKLREALRPVADAAHEYIEACVSAGVDRAELEAAMARGYCGTQHVYGPDALRAARVIHAALRVTLAVPAATVSACKKDGE